MSMYAHAEQPCFLEPVTERPLRILQLAGQDGGADVGGGGGAVVLEGEVGGAVVLGGEVGGAVVLGRADVGGGEGNVVLGVAVVAGAGAAVVGGGLGSVTPAQL